MKREAPETEGQRRSVRPFTGKQFLESIRDSREVWIYGERVKDVTTHPAFRNSARMLATHWAKVNDRTGPARAPCPGRSTANEGKRNCGLTSSHTHAPAWAPCTRTNMTSGLLTLDSGLWTLNWGLRTSAFILL